MRKTKMNKTTRNIALGLAVVSTFALYTPHAWAAVAPTDMPTGGKLTAGSASGMNTNAGTPDNPVQNITQSSDRAIITWDTYNLGKNGTMNYIQTSGPDAAVLNIVNSNNLSEIAGKINANANFAIYNPNGMIFYQGSTVNVGGFLATTTEIDTNNFMRSYSTDADLDKLNGSVRFIQNKGDKTKNASIVMDGIVNAQMNNPEFYNNAAATSPFHVLGDTAQATSFMPINNKIMLVADGNVKLGSHADLTAITTTTIGRKYVVGQEEYSVTAKAKSAKGEVLLRADANADNYVQNDVNLDGSTTEYALTDKKQAQVTAEGNHKIKGLTVNAYEAAKVLNDAESVNAITGSADTPQKTYARKDYAASHATLNVISTGALYNTGDKGGYTVSGTTASSGKSYYLVNDIYEIQAIDPAFNANGNLGGKYALSDDIVASETSKWNREKGFTPLNTTTGEFEFKGTNGLLYNTYNTYVNGIEYPLHKLTGLTIKQGTEHDDVATRDNVGFIKENHGTVMDVNFDGATVTGDEFVGIVAGQNIGGTLNNVNVSGSVQGHEHVGGMIGKDTGGTLSMVDNTATVTGVDTEAPMTNDYVGGIAGEAVNTNGSGGDLYNESTITGKNYVGGLFGKATGVSIGYSSNSGAVNGVDYVGGIAGHATNGSEQGSTNSGTIKGTTNVGGLLGYSAGNNSIDQSFNSGNVTGGENVGGLVGNYQSTGKISNSYNGDTISTSIDDSNSYNYTIEGMPAVDIPNVAVGGTFKINGITYTWDGTKYSASVTNNYNSATVFAANTWDATNLSKINNPHDGDQVTGADGTVYTYHDTGAGAVTDKRWEATTTIDYAPKDATVDPATGKITSFAKTAAEVLTHSIKNNDYYGFNYGGKNYKYDTNTKMYTEYTYAIDPATNKPVATATGKTYDEQEMQVAAPTRERVYTVRPTFVDANIKGDKNTGGLIGNMASGSIEHAYNVGTVTDTDTSATSQNDTGALVGNKTGGTIAADNVYWVDNTGRAEEDYHMFGSTTAAADYKGDHMSGVQVGIGNTQDTTHKIDLNALEEDEDVLTNTTSIGTLYKDQITPLLSMFLTTYKFNRELAYNGLTNSLITDDVKDLYGAGRFISSEDGVGRDVLNDAMTITKPEWVDSPQTPTDHPDFQAYTTDADGNKHFLYAKNIQTVTDPATGKQITTYETTEEATGNTPIYWKYERAYGTTQANGETWKYEYSEYSYADSSDLWSPQDAYKADTGNKMHITPKNLTITVYGEHEYGEDAIKGTNPIANEPNDYTDGTLTNDPSRYTIYGNILAFNDKFEDVIVGTLLYNGMDTTTGLLYNENGVTDGKTINAKTSYEFDHTKFSGKTALHNNYAISYEGKLNVTKAPLKVVIDDQTKVYGDANPTATGHFTTGWKNDDSADLTTGAAHLNNNGVYNGTFGGGLKYTVDDPLNPDNLTDVGVHTDAIVPAFDFTNYEVVGAPNGTLTITKADLVYTPNNQEKVYGQLNGLETTLDYSDKGSFAGWKGNDTFNDLHIDAGSNIPGVTGSLNLTTSATQQSDTGTYDIVANGDLDFKNYNITYKNSTLTVKKADLDFNANGEHYIGSPITMDDINITAVGTAADATASQANDGKLKSWDAISATDLKTLKGYAKDGTDDLILYMIDKDGNRNLINKMTEILFDSNNNIIGYKLLDGSFQRANGTYQLVSRNYIMKFKAGDGSEFTVKPAPGPEDAAFNATKNYGDWGNERRGTIRYLTVKGSGIARK